MNIEKITVEVVLKADMDIAWEYYTSPAHIVNWNFATSEWCCPYVENDLTKGGKYLARMEACDGSMGFDFEAIYDEIVVGERMAYTLGDGRKVTIVFRENGDHIKVTVTFDAETQNPFELQKEGWQAILNSFKRYATID